jgi:hypothetical protein
MAEHVPMIAPITPRVIGQAFMYRGINHVPSPVVVVERYDDIEKETRDCTVMFQNETMTWAFDFQLHTLDCPGPIDSAVPHVTSRQPCACGAWPGDPNHKFRALGRVKQRLETNAELEHGNLVVRFTDTPTEQPAPAKRKSSRKAS